MSRRRLAITAVLAGQSQSEVARTYGVSQGWISKLMARYRLEGQAAFEPLSRAPATSPAATPAPIVELACRVGPADHRPVQMQVDINPLLLNRDTVAHGGRLYQRVF